VLTDAVDYHAKYAPPSEPVEGRVRAIMLRQAQHERIVFRASFQSSPEQITVAPKKTPFALSLSKGPASAGQCQLVPPALRQAQHERIVFRAIFQSSPEQITVAPKKTPFALSLSKGPASAGQCQLVPPALRQAQHERIVFRASFQSSPEQITVAPQKNSVRPEPVEGSGVCRAMSACPTCASTSSARTDPVPRELPKLARTDHGCS
jgi:hypothetical protein